MDRLDAMRVFVAVVESGGFTAASRALGVPLPTVSRKVAELEDHLGSQLLIRTTRRVSATDAGDRYYEDAKRILDEISTIERQARGEYQRARGLLTITAPSVFGRMHVLPIITDFIRRHAEVEVRLVATTRVLDLTEQQIDVAVRFGTSPAAGLTVLPAGSIRQVICASPGYLDEHGRPAVPGDIVRHRCLAYAPAGIDFPWRFRMPSGELAEIVVRPKLTFVFGGDGQVDATLQGGGLSRMYAHAVAPHVPPGDLEIVLEPFEVEPTPVSLVVPQGPRVPRKVQAFVDDALPALQARLAGVAKACAGQDRHARRK